MMAVKPVGQFATGVTAELYRAAIGTRGQAYYLRHFTRFDADGKTGVSWHWPAYWNTLNWLIYRQMWGWALAYAAAVAGLALVIFGVGKLLLTYSDSTGWLLFLLFLTAAFALPGLYANAWYYSYCNERISAVLRETRDVNDARATLAAQASTERRWLMLAIVNSVVLASVVGVAARVFNDDPVAAVLAQSVQDTPPNEPAAEAPAWPMVATPAVHHGAAAAAPAAQSESTVAMAAPAQNVGQVASTPQQPEGKPEAASGPLAMAAKAGSQYNAPAEPEPAGGSGARLAAADGEQNASAAKKPRAAPLKAAGAATPKRSWLVQVGAFASEANAQNAQLKVEQTGLQTSAEPADTPNGRLIRVRAGPFDTKAEAERAAMRIRTLDLPALMIRR